MIKDYFCLAVNVFGFFFQTEKTKLPELGIERAVSSLEITFDDLNRVLTSAEEPSCRCEINYHIYGSPAGWQRVEGGTQAFIKQPCEYLLTMRGHLLHPTYLL